MDGEKPPLLFTFLMTLTTGLCCPGYQVTLKPLSCFDITMQRGCNILISYMVLDSENAISRASFVQVPSYHSARRQMNHVFCSVRLKSILKFRPYLRAIV